MDTIPRVIVLIIVIICLCLCLCWYLHRKQPYRPTHEKWYEDIPDSHPEVLDLIKQTTQQSHNQKKYTTTGFKKMKIPEYIYEYLKKVTLDTDRVTEGKDNIFRRTSGGPPPYLIPIPEEKKQWIHGELKPILENWSGVLLKPTSAYGPREYRRGSSLRMHVDREGTHIISAILHIGSEGLDEDWPLVIINRQNQRENIYMKPGEMLLYESASLPHSRELPLNGDYYINMFIHYRV